MKSEMKIDAKGLMILMGTMVPFLCAASITAYAFGWVWLSGYVAAIAVFAFNYLGRRLKSRLKDELA